MIRDGALFIFLAAGLSVIALAGWIEGYRRERRSWTPRGTAALRALGDAVWALSLAASVLVPLLTAPELRRMAGDSEVVFLALSLAVLGMSLGAGLSIGLRLEGAIHRRVDRFVVTRVP